LLLHARYRAPFVITTVPAGYRAPFVIATVPAGHKAPFLTTCRSLSSFSNCQQVIALNFSLPLQAVQLHFLLPAGHRAASRRAHLLPAGHLVPFVTTLLPAGHGALLLTTSNLCLFLPAGHRAPLASVSRLAECQDSRGTPFSFFSCSEQFT
jgi:hypothetical protein